MSCNHSYVLQAQRMPQNDLLYSCSHFPQYLAVYYHRSAARQEDKGRWAITEEQEAHRFYCAYDNQNKSDLYPGLWHIESGNTLIGTDGEVIAFFPAPINPQDFWHGYPFSFGRKAPKARIRALKETAENLFLIKKISLSRIKKIRNGSL